MYKWRCLVFFFFNDTATTEIYTLSLHDALPIWREADKRPTAVERSCCSIASSSTCSASSGVAADRKSTRLNSSHANISYAVFCLKKKNKNKNYICDIHTKYCLLLIHSFVNISRT